MFIFQCGMMFIYQAIDLYNTKDKILETCYEQIMDENWLCEVYIVSNIMKKDITVRLSVIGEYL